MIRQYFTLVELLVVLVIIAILASMLLPALKTARLTAVKITCVNQLKQNGITLHSYADDNHDFFPLGAFADKNGRKLWSNALDKKLYPLFPGCPEKKINPYNKKLQSPAYVVNSQLMGGQKNDGSFSYNPVPRNRLQTTSRTSILIDGRGPGYEGYSYANALKTFHDLRSIGMHHFPLETTVLFADSHAAAIPLHAVNGLADGQIICLDKGYGQWQLWE